MSSKVKDKTSKEDLKPNEILNRKQEEEERVIDSDENLSAEKRHLIWKKNTPCLYDLILTHSLDWPSLTVEFFKDIQQEDGYNVYRLLLGTNTSQTEQDSLMICSLKLPSDTNDIEYNPQTGEYGGYVGLSKSFGRIDTQIRINHDQEVNRARIMPQNQNVIATKSPSSKVYIFEITKHPSLPDDSNKSINAQMCLNGHSKEGFSLNWNVHNEGILLSGSDDSLICCWDINSTSSAAKIDVGDNASQQMLNLSPKNVFTFHSSVIEDVKWHLHNPSIFGSVSDDRSIAIWDTRASDKPQLVKFDAHDDDVNCLDFHYSSDNFFLTGSSDKTIKLWDLRNLEKNIHSFDNSSTKNDENIGHNHTNNDNINSNTNDDSENNTKSSSTINTINNSNPNEIIEEPEAKHYKDSNKNLNSEDKKSYKLLDKSLHTFDHHKSEVYSLQWCPHNDSIFASGSSDTTIKIWDLSLIGAEQSSQDALDGPPELLFVHGGHTERISDISWQISDPYMIASVADDNILHVWKMTSDLIESMSK